LQKAVGVRPAAAAAAVAALQAAEILKIKSSGMCTKSRHDILTFSECVPTAAAGQFYN